MSKATTVAVTGLVLIGAAGFGGYWYGTQRYASENIALNQQAQAAQSRLERVGNMNHLLNGRIELYKAAAQLDQRNFGLANTHLRNAAAALSSVDTAAVGIDTAAFSALREAVAKTDIAVAVDLEAQRNTVLKFSAELDALLPRGENRVAPAPATSPSPVAETSSGKPETPAVTPLAAPSEYDAPASEDKAPADKTKSAN